VSRWLFFLLLLCNLLVAAWGLTRAPHPAASPPPPAPAPAVRVLPWDLPKPPVAPPPAEPEGCIAFGPFSDQDPALRLLERLAAAPAQARIRVISHARTAGFWVLIPADRLDANLSPEALAAKGIADSWRFRRGHLAGALSLGLYASRERAATRLKELAGLGVTAEIRPRRVEDESYVVEARAAAGRLHEIESLADGAAPHPCEASAPTASPPSPEDSP